MAGERLERELANVRQAIAQACDLLMGDECDMAGALKILGSLCGRRYALASPALDRASVADLRKLAAGPNRTFKGPSADD